MSLKNFKFNSSWTLFLDRDGVINRRLPSNYVKTPDEFVLLPHVAEAIAVLGRVFGKIIVVSNQQGVGKGLMTEAQLELVHAKMQSEIAREGGRLDAIFFSPHLENRYHFMRKPNVGMGLAARKKFPSIDFKRSVMVGDTLSDMMFGKRLGMKTVLVGASPIIAREHYRLVDFYFAGLPEMATTLAEAIV